MRYKLFLFLSYSLRDIDLKFAQDFMGQQTEDGSVSMANQHLNSPDWFAPPPPASAKKYGYLYVRKYKFNGPPGLNFTSRRPMEIPEYEGGFVDRDTVWREPLFPIVSSQNELSSSTFSPPCLSYEYLSSSSTAHVPRGQKYRAGITDFPKGPNWQYKDLRGVFNQRYFSLFYRTWHIANNKLKSEYQREQEGLYGHERSC